MLGIPLLTAVVMLALSAVLVFLTHRLVAEKQQLGRQIEQQIGEHRDTLRQALLDEQWASLYGERFATLMAQGVFGGENRLEWSESLKEVARETGIVNLQFTIAPRKPFHGTIPASDDVTIFYSDMTLVASLLHSGDLVRLVDSLRRRGIGIFTAQECTLQRDTAAVQTIDQASLTAKCLFRWFTLEKQPA